MQCHSVFETLCHSSFWILGYCWCPEVSLIIFWSQHNFGPCLVWVVAKILAYAYTIFVAPFSLFYWLNRQKRTTPKFGSAWNMAACKIVKSWSSLKECILFSSFAWARRLNYSEAWFFLATHDLYGWFSAIAPASYPFLASSGMAPTATAGEPATALPSRRCRLPWNSATHTRAWQTADSAGAGTGTVACSEGKLPVSRLRLYLKPRFWFWICTNRPHEIKTGRDWGGNRCRFDPVFSLQIKRGVIPYPVQTKPHQLTDSFWILFNPHQHKTAYWR
jgi:hypothetical protein